MYPMTLHRRPDSPARWFAPLAAALALHALALLLPWPRWAPDDALPLDRHLLDEFSLVTLLAEDRLDTAPLSGQFVSLPPPDDTRRPEEARFRDRVDRSAERETVNRRDPTGPGSATVPPAPNPSPRATPPAARSGAARAAGDQPRDSLPNPLDAAGDVVATPEPARARPGEGEAEHGVDHGDGVDLSAFRPTLENTRDLLAPAGVRVDHLDLPDGERTELNAWQSVYWGFFHRMKERLLQHWRPADVMRRHDPTHALYGVQDRYTVLTVTLNPDGTLRHAHVKRSSELDFLDREAIRAFQAAQPFPNIPEGLKGTNGLVTFDFGFNLGITSRSTLSWSAP